MAKTSFVFMHTRLSRAYLAFAIAFLSILSVNISKTVADTAKVTIN